MADIILAVTLAVQVAFLVLIIDGLCRPGAWINRPLWERIGG